MGLSLQNVATYLQLMIAYRKFTIDKASEA